MKNLFLIAAMVLFSHAAHAQTTTFTGPDGRYLGSATTNGNTTRFYGPDGRYLGSAQGPCCNVDEYTSPEPSRPYVPDSRGQPMFFPNGQYNPNFKWGN